MGRFRQVQTGVVFSVSDDKDGRYGGELYELYDGDGSESESAGYGSMKVTDLRAEIGKRNEGREEADQVSAEGNKAALVAALEADDAANNNA